jgi:curved DNA-binding protein CbpA
VATYYEVLGLAPSASADEVRRAYRERARLVHPDASGSTNRAQQRDMQDLNEAFRVLRDPSARAAYDAWLQAGATPDEHDDLDPMDRPYRHAAAAPGDLSVAIVRAIPWLAVLVLLALIFVVTAYAGGDDAPERCVNPGAGISGTPCPENPGE